MQDALLVSVVMAADDGLLTVTTIVINLFYSRGVVTIFTLVKLQYELCIYEI